MSKSKATEALRVAQEVVAIRTALKKRGYHLRKRPKQASWSIYVNDDNIYMLTYQPAPISSWVLHPENDDSDCSKENGKTERHRLETVIQRALIQQSTGRAGRVS
jgi:hypothetical protein